MHEEPLDTDPDELFWEPRELAPRLRRLAANITDTLAGLAAFFPILITAVAHEYEWPGASIIWMLVSGVGLAVFQLYFLTTRGQTLGKWLLGIQIVRFDDETNPGFIRAVLARGVLFGCVGLIPIVGFLIQLANPLFIFAEDRRCLHDHVAGTKVVWYQP